ILLIEHRGKTFDAFPRRSHLHIPIDRSTPLLNRGTMSFLLPYHTHALFVVIELLSDEYIQVSRGMSDAARCPLVAQMSVARCLPQTPSWVTFSVRMPSTSWLVCKSAAAASRRVEWLGQSRFASAELACWTEKSSGSYDAPTHWHMRSCSGCLGFCQASRNKVYPPIPPASSGG